MYSSSLYMADSLLKSLLKIPRISLLSSASSCWSCTSRNFVGIPTIATTMITTGRMGPQFGWTLGSSKTTIFSRPFLLSWHISIAATSNTTHNSSSASSTDDVGSGGVPEYLIMSDEELMRQCQMDTFKSSGPGGQHRNKRESSVRLKHLPTGIVAQAVEDRSQHRNRASALSRLRTLLALKVM